MAWDASGQSWTAAELVSDVRRVASLPTTSTDFTDLVILREACDVLWSFAGWAMQQAGDGRLVELLQRPVTALLTSDYRASSECELPPLAVADTVESVVFLAADGRTETRLVRVDHAGQSAFDTPVSEGVPRGYALVGSRLRLYPRPSQGGTIRLTYQRRHPVLVPDLATALGTVQSVLGTGATTTQVTWLTPMSGFVVGDVVDVLNNQHPYRPLIVGATVGVPVMPTSLVLNVAASTFGTLSMAGARVVKTGTSPYVHYPLELRAAVTEKTAANLMRRVGDLTNAQASDQTAQQELARVMQMLSPRVKRDHVRAINPSSHLRAAGRRGWTPR